MSTNNKQLDDIQMDASNLYREETITDLQTGTIKILTPINVDGTTDSARPAIYLCQTELMSHAGPIPVSAPLEVASLAEAVEQFPKAVKKAVDEMIQRAQEYQREQASRIVTPGELGGRAGPGGGGKGGGLII